jgi:hypothetical protein
MRKLQRWVFFSEKLEKSPKLLFGFQLIVWFFYGLVAENQFYLGT